MKRQTFNRHVLNDRYVSGLIRNLVRNALLVIMLLPIVMVNAEVEEKEGYGWSEVWAEMCRGWKEQGIYEGVMAENERMKNEG